MANQPKIDEDSTPVPRRRFGATASLTKLRGLLPLASTHTPPVEIDPTPIPVTTVARRRAASLAASLDRDESLPDKISVQQEHGVPVQETEKTVLYLAYGSNLATKTFRGVRGIKPLSQISVLVPELRLTFDLPGLPYAEPCFAGTQYRDVSQKDHLERDSESEELSEKAALMGQSPDTSGYHKRRWHKPLIGVVYEVTVADYAKIIASEGGGRGYRNGVIDCHPFPESYDSSDPVPDFPTTPAFQAHTLLSPSAYDARCRTQSQKSSQLISAPALSLWYTICLHVRPDPDYAQPSARYLGLIKTGAAEHDLPISYQQYLAQIRTYHVTTTRQKIGKAIFLLLWIPWVLLALKLTKACARPGGWSPPWLVAMTNILFSAIWASYDWFFAWAFGNGERTLTDIPV